MSSPQQIATETSRTIADFAELHNLSKVVIEELRAYPLNLRALRSLGSMLRLEADLLDRACDLADQLAQTDAN